MIVADISQIAGRRYPARRWTRGIAGKGLPIEAKNFSMGYVVLDPRGGQVPWHSHEQEEVYFLFEGTCEICVGTERRTIDGGHAVYIPPGAFHQLTNVGEGKASMLYVYSPAGEVAHWREELSGTLPRAGREAPPLPEGAWPQWSSESGG